MKIEKTINTMIITIEIRHMMVLVTERYRTYRLMVFAEMDEARARRLAAEYGYAEGNIVAVSHETLHYRRYLSDEQVQAVLERMPYREKRTPEQILDAVRCIVPQATRIIER